MRWSKLKQLVESRFAEGIRGRVDLRTTRYHKAHDNFGRSWITIDGHEIINMSNYLKCGDSIAMGNPARFKNGLFAGCDLSEAMREFLTLSIIQALQSESPLIRALAVLDRRAGKLRLSRMNSSGEHPIVVKLLRLRLSASTNGILS